MSKNLIKIFLAYQGKKKTLEIIENSTIAEAIANEAIYQDYLKQVAQPKIGIFGKVVNQSKILSAGDRIELYEPLTDDPMEKRFKKAKASPFPPKHLRR